MQRVRAEKRVERKIQRNPWARSVREFTDRYLGYGIPLWAHIYLTTYRKKEQYRFKHLWEQVKYASN